MRRLLLTAVLLISAAGAESQQVPEVPLAGPIQKYSFANLKWGTPKAIAKAQLTSAGYAFVKEDEDGDLLFKGELVGYDAIIYELIADGKLAKISITLVTPDNKARRVYGDMKETLISKYGAPKDNFEYFQKPYYEGDGYEDQAIRVGKATFASFWMPEGVTGPEALALSISERLTVQLSYESAAWSAEADLRKKKATKVF